MACSAEPPANHSKIDYSKIKHTSSQTVDVVEHIDLEKIVLEPGTNANNFSSMQGEFLMVGDTILFGDRGVARIFKYGLSGKRLGTSIVKGRGPNEIVSLENFAVTRSGERYAILGAGWNIYILNDSLNITDKDLIHWGKFKSNREFRDKLNNPNPNDLHIYEREMCRDNVKFLSKDKLLFPIVTDHTNYNGYQGENAPHFYGNSNTLGIYSIDSKKVEMAINRSPIYQEIEYLSKFKNIIIETVGDTLFYSFEADPHIYKYNLADSVISSFGECGVNMNTEYVTVKTFAESEKINKKDFGYYLSLKYFEESSLLFRTYNKGAGHRMAGMQVYRSGVLIADCEVPDNFKVFGYCAPYYYGYGVHDIENLSMSIYRFRI